MSTSVFTAATADHLHHSHHLHQGANPNPQNHHHDGDHPVRPSSGRRRINGCDSSSSVQKKNKQPRRGMGVAKLERERLRLDMSKINSAGPGTVSFPDQISKLGGFRAPNVDFNHNPGGCYSDFHQYGHMDLFGLSNPGVVRKSYAGGVLSREITLSTNAAAVKCFSEHCNACHKKKKFNVGDSSGKQGHVEIVAVHRKGACGSSSSSLSEGDVMMEYEFFPTCNKIEHPQNGYDELVMMNMGQQTNSSSMPGFGRHVSTCVDLSLKLSY